MFCPIINLAKELINIPSISPLDLGCQNIIAKRLSSIGFTVEIMNFKDTCNLWATRGKGKTLTLLGHTDVVHPGKICHWNSLPFESVVKDGMLFGRGSADMKGALAAMVVAVERCIASVPKHNGRLSFLITSDEESSAVNGTKKVLEKLNLRNEKIDYCLVGEPSSSNILGDVIKNGRRGSMTANLTIYGIQGHVAYPQFAKNPIHFIVPFLSSLISTEWSIGNINFPSTSMQLTDIRSGKGGNNIIPGEIFIQFNFRFGNDITSDNIKDIVNELLSKHLLKYTINWNISAKPFLTRSGNLLNTVKKVVKHVGGIIPKVLTTGGTSDGRFFSIMGAQVVELGLINKTIHKVNEYTKVVDLQLLTKMYENIIKDLIF
ncbi:succinyl-diaminopimelate desuccinylase [Buchnera aphidicola]|uniref:succinyl-diaminopimelate desuccinylase n=1 Tax=Buchnera aphidicola TaxID=9 RepID=UPI0034639DFF